MDNFLLLIFYATSFQVCLPQAPDSMDSRDRFGIANGSFGFTNVPYWRLPVLFIDEKRQKKNRPSFLIHEVFSLWSIPNF